MNKNTIVGKRAGTYVVLSVTKGKMVIKCDCGKITEKFAPSFYKTKTCGDRTKHNYYMHSTTHGLSDTYLYKYYTNTTKIIKTCIHWSDISIFATEIGKQPTLKHSLGRINHNILSCGTCEECIYKQYERNVIWFKGRTSNSPLHKYKRSWLTQKKIAEKLGLTGAAISSRIKNNLNLNRPKYSRNK